MIVLGANLLVEEYGRIVSYGWSGRMGRGVSWILGVFDDGDFTFQYGRSTTIILLELLSKEKYSDKYTRAIHPMSLFLNDIFDVQV